MDLEDPPNRLSPEFPENVQSQIQLVKTIWKSLLELNESKGWTRDGILEGMFAEVEDLLSNGMPIDLNMIESLTAKAALSISGKQYF